VPDDLDHDGYNELLELALGLSPVPPSAGGLPSVNVKGGHLTVTITKIPGVTYEVQSKGTLLPAQADAFNAASTTVRDNFLITAAPGRFVRVKVTAAP